MIKYQHLALLLAIGLIILGGWVIMQKVISTQVVSLSQDHTEVVQAVMGDLSNSMVYTGVIAPKRLAKLQSMVSGRVVEVCAEVGDRVQEGKILVRLSNVELEQRMQSLEQQLLHSRMQWNHWKTSQTMREHLWSIEMMTQDEWDANVLTGRELEISLDAIQRQYDMLKKELDELTIRAPFDGRITQVFVKEREVVTGILAMSGGHVLMVLADEHALVFQSDISAGDIGSLRLGMQGVITFEGVPNYYEQGIVFSLASEGQWTGQGMRAYPMVMDFASDHDEVRPYMNAQVTLNASHVRNSVLVPLTAVFQSGGQSVIYRQVRRGKFAEVRIVAGLNNAQHLQVLQGINPGEWVAKSRPNPKDITK